MPFLQVYFAFASGYLFSYLLRTVNAVISPELTRDLGLSPSALGLLTSAYFIAFGAMQIPAGMALDRFGPRRVEPVLVLVAGLATLWFALAGDTTSLLAARALIGVGVSVCLMAPMKGIAVWYPPVRQASLSSWIMVAGGIGALLSTTPLEMALHHVSWRTIFLVLATTAVVIAAWIWWRVPDTPVPASATGFSGQWDGVRRIFASARFWWIGPLAGLGMGSFMAIQGLWSVPWLIEVNGYDRAIAAQHLLMLNLVIVSGYFLIGVGATSLTRFGIEPKHLFVTGFAICGIALGGILAKLPGTYFWWSLYGFGASANIVSYTVLNAGFAREFAGRANTSLNLMMFIGSFVTQWGIGVIVDLVRQHASANSARGLEVAFLAMFVLHWTAYAWFVAGWRRHAQPPAQRIGE